METVADIFDLLGGPAEAGRAMGITTEHASTLKRRGSVPIDYWPGALEGLRAKGHDVSEADLLRCHLGKAKAA